MTCVRCQTWDTAKACGTEERVYRELQAQIDRLMATTVPKAEHDRLLRALEKSNELLRRRK